MLPKSTNKLKKDINALAKKENKSPQEILETKINQLTKVKATYDKSASSVELKNIEQDRQLLTSSDESSDNNEPMVVAVKRQPKKYTIPKKKGTASSGQEATEQHALVYNRLSKGTKKVNFQEKAKAKRKAAESSSKSEDSLHSEERAFQKAARELADDPDINNYNNIWHESVGHKVDKTLTVNS